MYILCLYCLFVLGFNNNQSVTFITNRIYPLQIHLSCITQKHFEKNKIREILIRPTCNKNVMATFNVPGYVQVYVQAYLIHM